MKALLLHITQSPKYQSWLKIGMTFLTGQGILQALQLATGLLIVRTMPIEQYAQYTLAFAMQSTALMLVEGGFSGSVIDLVGVRVQDKKVIGSYVKAAAYYRNRLLLGVGCLFSIIFFFITARYDWPWHSRVLLLLSILLTLVFSAYINLYRPVLQIAKDFSLMYRTDIYQAFLRLLVVCLLYVSIGLIAWQLALVSAFVLLGRGFALRRAALQYMDEPIQVSENTKKEMLHYVKPLFPGIIFSAFQGQVMILMVGLFGGSQAIAEVGALGRLAQLFLLFNTASGMLLIPYFARQAHKGLLRKYIAIVSLIVLVLLAIVVGIYCFPNLLLILLGAQYSDLSSELVLMISTASINVLNGVMWGMNKSRKWIFNWMPWIGIPGTLIVQALSLYYLDMSSTYNVLLMGFYTSLFSFFTRINVAIYGLGKINYENG